MTFSMCKPRRGLEHGASDTVNAHVLRLSSLALAVGAVTLLSGHVAPSLDDNNRYLKLTPLGDRVRLAYTVFFGEVPGATERRTIDTNGDGHIDDAEAHAFALRLGAEVARGLTAELDGAPARVDWAVVDPGMGTPAVAAGAFSVDLVAYLCLPSPRGRHRVVVRDRFRIAHPGETEVQVDDGPPGVTIETARVGSAEDPTYDYRFVGPGGPIESEGLELVFFVAEQATASRDATCPGMASPRATDGAGRTWLWLVILAALALATVVVAALLVHRRRR
jgi:hypothetical protein